MEHSLSFGLTPWESGFIFMTTSIAMFQIIQSGECRRRMKLFLKLLSFLDHKDFYNIFIKAQLAYNILLVSVVPAQWFHIYISYNVITLSFMTISQVLNYYNIIMFPFTFFTLPATHFSPLATISLMSVSMSLFLFHLLLLFFLIPHVSEMRWYLSFFDLFHLG